MTDNTGIKSLVKESDYVSSGHSVPALVKPEQLGLRYLVGTDYSSQDQQLVSLLHTAIDEAMKRGDFRKFITNEEDGVSVTVNLQVSDSMTKELEGLSKYYNDQELSSIAYTALLDGSLINIIGVDEESLDIRIQSPVALASERGNVKSQDLTYNIVITFATRAHRFTLEKRALNVQLAKEDKEHREAKEAQELAKAHLLVDSEEEAYKDGADEDE